MQSLTKLRRPLEDKEKRFSVITHLDKLLGVVLRLVGLVAQHRELGVVLGALGATHLLFGELKY